MLKIVRFKINSSSITKEQVWAIPYIHVGGVFKNMIDVVF